MPLCVDRGSRARGAPGDLLRPPHAEDEPVVMRGCTRSRLEQWAFGLVLASGKLILAEVLDELGGMERFGEELEVVAALAGSRENLDRGGLAAEEHNAGFGQKLLDGDGRFDTVNMGHEDVGKDELGVGAPGGFDGFASAVGSFGDESIAIEDLNDGIGDEGFVVYDEDPCGGGRRGAITLLKGCGREQVFARVMSEERGVHRGPVRIVIVNASLAELGHQHKKATRKDLSIGDRKDGVYQKSLFKPVGVIRYH